MKNHLVIGITGGIGSGKSTVLDILKNEYGGYILEADKIGHIVMEPGGLCYDDIISNFGTCILNDDKTINRKVLGSIVFSNKEKLSVLNGIIHPNVKKYITDEIIKIQNSCDFSIVFIEAALLIEDHYETICDYLWYIYADKDVRFLRVKESRNMDRQKFDDIVSNQLSDEVFKEKCHVIIDNSNSMEHTKHQISIELNKLTKED